MARKSYPSLAAYLEATGQSQQELAAALGISPAQVSDYVAGRSLPRPELIVRIADLTGVAIEAMVRMRAKVAEAMTSARSEVA